MSKLSSYYHHVYNGGIHFDVTKSENDIAIRILTQYYDYPAVEAKLNVGNAQKGDNVRGILEGIGNACLEAAKQCSS